MEIDYNIGNNSNTRLELCKIIMKKIHENGWTKTIAAEKLGIDQPQIAQLQKQIENEEIYGFSLKRLLYFLKILNYDIKITIEDKDKK